jgi:TRAP-type C4-dicarboxylate transport system permease small subunit
METLEKISNRLNQALLWVAGLFLFAMITITGANIVFRLFGLPIRGTFELMGYFGAIVTAFALGYTQIKRGHIAVDIVVLRFSEKTQRILHAFNHLICMVFFIRSSNMRRHSGKQAKLPKRCRSSIIRSHMRLPWGV